MEVLTLQQFNYLLQLVKTFGCLALTLEDVKVPMKSKLQFSFLLV